MAQENKVFDIANPGSSKPETGSKPMVVGHKNLLDPTLKGPVESESASTEPMAARTEKTISPTLKTTVEVPEKAKESNNESVIASNEEKDTVPESAPEPTPEQPQTPEITPESVTEPTSEAPVETAEEKQKTEDDLEVAREDKLQEMIKSKEFYAPINEASFSSFQSFLKTFIIVVLLGIIVLVVLIDAEILDVGINLPFNFL